MAGGTVEIAEPLSRVLRTERVVRTPRAGFERAYRGFDQMMISLELSFSG